MIDSLRTDFNARFTPERYRGYLDELDRRAGTRVGFRVCETPLFIDAAFEAALYRTAMEILDLTMQPEHLSVAKEGIPEGLNFEQINPHPGCAAIDFAVTADSDGRYNLKLIELQGFPTLFGWQELLGRTAREEYGYESLRHLPASMTVESYDSMLRDWLLGGYSPDEAVLLEVDPWNQKTLPDFLDTRRRTGIPIVDITAVECEGSRLYYRNERGERIRIRRVYNRAIMDEIARRNIVVPFRFTDALDVEWASHPAWDFLISKHSIPYLRHPAVPRSVFLHEMGDLPPDLDRWVLKPLHSFAGSGVIVGPEERDIVSIPSHMRRHYLLQERVEYAPALATPHGGAKVELRVLILWDKEPIACNILVRTGRGKMMGVDFNKNMEWVGTSCALVV